MTPHLQTRRVTLHHGDCREVLAQLPDASVDAVVTDPPYGISFMGKEWDRPTPGGVGVCTECGNEEPADGWRQCLPCLEAGAGPVKRYRQQAPMLGQISANWHEKATQSRGYADNDNHAFQLWCQEWATEVLRVLKPGGHLLAFGGTRTYHRLACAVEDAGFEIRDSIHWLYGSGFPKSLDVSKAIDKAAGAEREVVGPTRPGAQSVATNAYGAWGDGITPTAPATPEAEQWQGWGTALKPAHEPVVVARKPLEGTVAANVLAHGTGAINVDGCRVGMGAEYDPSRVQRQQRSDGVVQFGSAGLIGTEIPTYNPQGRWPANVVLDGEAAAELDRQSGWQRDGVAVNRNGHDPDRQGYGKGWGAEPRPDQTFGGEGGASRFFFRADLTDDDLTSFRYVAKPDRAERDAGLGDLEAVHRANGNKWTDQDYRVARGERPPSAESGPRQNFHPTVKPLDLMRWLVRLVTPPGGVVLDPFAGSGTTLAAAVLEDRQAVGIELTDDYLPIIAGRVAWAEREARFGAVQGPTKVRKETPGAVSLFDEVEQ